MTQKWIDAQEGYKVGDVGFLINFSHENTGGESYILRDTPAHTNQSRTPRLMGWCGSDNNVSTHACGVWKVVRIAKNGRTLVDVASEEETTAFLEEVGYPDLTDD